MEYLGHRLVVRTVRSRQGDWKECYCNKCRHEDWAIAKFKIKCVGTLRMNVWKY